MSKYLPAMIKLMLEIASNKGIDMAVRQSALSFVQTVVTMYNPPPPPPPTPPHTPISTVQPLARAKYL